jgi:hypothetical protein
MLKKRRKVPYLLLELLIAFTLVAYASLLFIRAPLEFMDREIKLLEEIELQRMADCAFADIKVGLHASVQQCVNLPQEAAKARRVRGKEALNMHLKGIAAHPFYLNVRTWVRAHKADKEEHEKWCVRVVIDFTAKNERRAKKIKQFEYIAFVDHAPKKVETKI